MIQTTQLMENSRKKQEKEKKQTEHHEERMFISDTKIIFTRCFHPKIKI